MNLMILFQRQSQHVGTEHILALSYGIAFVDKAQKAQFQTEQLESLDFSEIVQ